jgi:hypothetical protein
MRRTLVVLILLGTAWSQANTPIPPAFFGLHINRAQSAWPAIPVPAIRLLSTFWSNWGNIERTAGTYVYDRLDYFVNQAVDHGADVLFVFVQVPRFYSSNPDGRCAYQPGSCFPPKDLNPDGSGSNEAFKRFVASVAAHYGTKIKYWEIWNEHNMTGQWQGTDAQLTRMAEDARCIIAGKGHITALHQDCRANPINPAAEFLTPSTTGEFIVRGIPGAAKRLNDYLSTRGASDAADIISFHGYAGDRPEDVLPIIRAVKSVLGPSDRAKPLWDTENSWGVRFMISDAEQQAAFLARSYLLHASEGVQRYYWFGWDFRNTGKLWDADQSTSCTIPHKGGGYLCASGRAFAEVQKWLIGNRISAPCAARGSIWTCGITTGQGQQTTAVWDSDSQYACNGSCPTNPWNFDLKYGRYIDLAGTETVITGSKVNIGARPILLTPAGDNDPNGARLKPR